MQLSLAAFSMAGPTSLSYFLKMLAESCGAFKHAKSLFNSVFPPPECITPVDKQLYSVNIFKILVITKKKKNILYPKLL